MDAALKTLNDHLASSTFIANDELTLADVCVVCTLYPAMARALDAKAGRREQAACFVLTHGSLKGVWFQIV